MTGTAALALVEAAWRERWNRNWRFSRFKPGLWLLLIQLGLAAAALWRLGGQRGATSFGAAALAMVLQAGVWSFIAVFLMGRSKLYGGRAAVRLVHSSPAPAWSVLAAEVAAGLPGRAWSMLVWAGTLGNLLPASDWWWAVPLLWLAGLTMGSLGQMAGLLALVAWVRALPRALAGTWAAVIVLQLVLVYYGLYLVVSGASLEALAGLRGWIVGGLAALLGLPGALMLVWLAARPGRLGAAYREGWLAVAELGDAGARPGRSRWPAFLPAAAGAVQAREWLYAWRNPWTLLRAGVTVLLLAGLVPFGPRLAGGRPELMALAAGVGLVYFAFSEMASALFSNESGRAALWVLTGARPGRVLLGKLAAALPLALLTSGATWAAAAAMGAPAPAVLAAQGAAIGLGMAGLFVGAGALDVALRDHQEEDPETEGVSAALEQVPRGPFSVTGMALAGAFGAGAVWWPWAGWGALLWLLPVAALAAGYARLRVVLRG